MKIFKQRPKVTMREIVAKTELTSKGLEYHSRKMREEGILDRDQSSTNISRSLREIINKNGTELNTFWNGILPKKLQGIDFFNNENANQITYNILIDTLNIFRGISNYLDKIILKSFILSEFLVKEVFVEFKSINGYKNFKLTDERNKRKFLGFCKTEYGFEPTEYDFQEMV